MSATPTSWHLDEPLARRYANDDLDAVTAASVETHLLRCASCRAALAAAGPPAQRLDGVWDAVADQLDRPRAGLLERVLRGFGLGEGDARLLAATPSLQLSWVLAVLLVLGLAVAAAHGGDDVGAVFLLVAPLLPVAGVAGSYGPGIDPAYDMTLATPYRATRLLLLRSASVLLASVALAGAAAVTLPATGWYPAAWLLPALGLTATTLAVATRVTPTAAAAAVSLAWLAVVLQLGRLGRTADVAGAQSQLAFLTLVVAAAAVVVVRREQFDTRSSA